LGWAFSFELGASFVIRHYVIHSSRPAAGSPAFVIVQLEIGASTDPHPGHFKWRTRRMPVVLGHASFSEPQLCFIIFMP
jgi:hypothetical protein